MINFRQVLDTQGIHFSDESINGIDCTIGYIKEFRWSWMATQLNTFIFIGQADGTIDRQAIESFSAACYEYAIRNNKGWPRGLQAAVGSIAILCGNNIESPAIDFCTRLSKKHWSAFEIPVLFDLQHSEAIMYSHKPMWGAIYFSYFTKTIKEITGEMQLQAGRIVN